MMAPFHVRNSLLPRTLFISASLLFICRIRILIGMMSRIGCSPGHCAKSGCMNRLGLNALSRSDAIRRNRMMRLVGTSREDYDCGKYGDLFHFISLGMFGQAAFFCQTLVRLNFFLKHHHSGFLRLLLMRARVAASPASGQANIRSRF
ncbi:hypothetical protein B0W47_03925 [Komagataeibacter nataicola]|uniref:Uncharacterized protein n=1 Tax=Komagataeibacter nataicola TaxID=265960 RepID=A0A9N7H0E8_9PROT|nr:hypothetical protein B0W47_03925 [Komagataeibacter nataicola]PYD64847.1 hypothetical protein CDI09_17005 [Komagataeibacter nataicola]